MKRSVTHPKSILLFVLLAILLRLALMPFLMHMDLLSEFRRINYAFENLSFYTGFNRLTVFYIETLFYSLTNWFVVNPDMLLYLPDPAHSTSSIPTHFIFSGDSHVFRHLFLFKLPYLVFDLLSALLIWRYFDGHRLRTAALMLWLFNPVTIYASYVFGRFEVISLFFLIWTALSLKNEKFIVSAIIFGLALNCREINLIFVPAFFLALVHWRESISENLIRVSSCALIVLLFLKLPYLIQIVFNAQPLFTSESGISDLSRGLSSFFDSGVANIYPFFLISAICYFALLVRRDLDQHEMFVLASLSVVVPFFIIAFKSAHYFSWTMPFLVLACYRVKHLIIPICALCVSWFVYWLFSPEPGMFTLLLATPLHEAFFGFNNFSRFYTDIFPGQDVLRPAVLQNTFRTLAVAAMAIILYRANKESAGRD